MHNGLTKAKNGQTTMLQCPFAHYSNVHNRPTQEQDPPRPTAATNRSLPLYGPLPPPPTITTTAATTLASLLEDTCPLDTNCQTIHDEIIPPEHEELKKGYDGKTCPFLESAGLGDHDEGNEDKEMKDHEGLHDDSLFHPTRSSPSAATTYQHDKVFDGEEREAIDDNDNNNRCQTEKSMNHCPCHHNSRSSSMSSISSSSSRNGPISQALHEFKNDLQSSMTTTNNSKLLSSPPLPSSSSSTPPQTVHQARRQMDVILSAQKKAQEAIHTCQQRLLQAQQELDRAMLHKSSLDRMAMDSAGEWTDMLLQDDTRNAKWNNMYRKLKEYKAKYGHVDVKRQLTKKEKEMDPDLAALSQWVGKNRSEGKRVEQGGGGGDMSLERLEPYKIVALNRLGFDWAPRDNAWMQNYERVKVYLEKNPGKLPQRRKSELGVWANGQIIEYNKFMAGNSKAYITQHKIDLLNMINFPWDRSQNTWLERYQALKEFHSKYGHCRVTKTYEDQVLYRWVTKERMKYRNYLSGEKPCQTTEQWKLLEKLDFMEGTKISVVAKKRKLEVGDESSELDGILFCPNSKRLVSDCDSTSA